MKSLYDIVSDTQAQGEQTKADLQKQITDVQNSTQESIDILMSGLADLYEMVMPSEEEATDTTADTAEDTATDTDADTETTDTAAETEVSNG